MRLRGNGRYFILFFMAGFLLGILYANVVAKDYVAAMGMFNEYFLSQYAREELDVQDYGWYIFRVRMTPVAMLAAAGCLKIRRWAAAFFLVWTGFLSGMLVTSAIIRMGMKGILFCLTAITPHFLFYAGSFLILLWCLYTYPKSRWDVTKTLAFLLLFATGMILECHVNPILMKMFIKTI